MRKTRARLQATHKRIAQIIDARKNKALAEKGITRAIRSGAVIVYPTDTVYGVGCDARCARAIKKIRRIKKRSAAKPFSVIAPSRRWIRANCVLSKSAAHAVNRLLPGRYTLVLRLKNKRCVARETNAGRDTLGVRLPRHWIAGVVREARVPLVTTSVNESSEPPARTLAEIKSICDDAADLIVFEGALRGKPSRVIDFTENSARVTRA